jgi:hypothetical protein
MGKPPEDKPIDIRAIDLYQLKLEMQHCEKMGRAVSFYVRLNNPYIDGPVVGYRNSLESYKLQGVKSIANEIAELIHSQIESRL